MISQARQPRSERPRARTTGALTAVPPALALDLGRRRSVPPSRAAHPVAGALGRAEARP